MSAVKLHRLRLKPHGATLSPWQADTLFGHLCWEAFFQGGPKALQEFLAPFRAGKPPFVISDGFPNDTFPCPLLPPGALVRGDKCERERAMDAAKERKKITRLSHAQFEQFLRDGSLLTGTENGLVSQSRFTLKNQINRLTSTTRGATEDEKTGNLYAVREFRFYSVEEQERVPAHITIYIWAENDGRAQEAETWFRLLARGGFGKKKSAGYGRFDVLSHEPFSLTTPAKPNGLVALANFVPAPSDPPIGLYKTRVKYGKLGEAAILNGKALSPFKLPLMMLTAGSTFYCDAAVPPFVGKLVESIHPDDPTIVHGAFAPVVPIKLPPEA
jgi:CRISPR-associated protein Csm4